MPLSSDGLLEIQKLFGITSDRTLKDTLGLTAIEQTLTTFNEKLTSIEKTLTDKLTALEKSNTQVLLMIDSDRKKNEKTFNDLREADETLKSQITEKDEQLSTLTSRLSQLERRAAHNEQHGRRWNIEIDGIPNSVSDADLEPIVLDILESIGVHCDSTDIEAAHRLPAKPRTESKPVIVRFCNRKTVDLCWSNKSRLKSIDTFSIRGIENAKIFFNPSLCTYYKELAYNCRLLKKEGQITKVKTDDNGVISIVLLSGATMKIKHHLDLKEKFEGFKSFTFDKIRTK